MIKSVINKNNNIVIIIYGCWKSFIIRDVMGFYEYKRFSENYI